MSDPCQLFVDAVAASNAEIAALTDSLAAALLLLDDRLEALANCRDLHPGSGPGGEGLMDEREKVKKALKHLKGD